MTVKAKIEDKDKTFIKGYKTLIDRYKRNEITKQDFLNNVQNFLNNVQSFKENPQKLGLVQESTINEIEHMINTAIAEKN
jgi:hypothetical protein